MGKSNQTFSILFFLKKNWRQDNGSGHIYQRITINGRKAAISINRTISVDLWDVHKGVAKPKGKDAEEINAHIEAMRNKAYNAYTRLLESNKTLTPQAIIDEILGKTERQHTLISFFEKHNKMMQSSIGAGATYGNYKNFKTSLKYLKEFVHSKYKCDDLPLTDIDKDFITNYYLFLQRNKNCHHNGAIKQLQRCKKVISLAISRGLILRSPFINYRLKFDPYDRIILTMDELSTIENLNHLSTKQQLTLDSFLFACYTGLSFIDAKNLTHSNIVKGIDDNLWIVTRRQKSNVKARVPLLPKALQLVEKYRDHPKMKENRVIPLYSNQKTNDYLKEIANLAGIAKPLSYSVGRHVFATVVTLSNGVPIETVSKALGHTSIRTTQIYSRVVDEKIAADFAKLRNVLDKNQPDEGSHNP